MRHVVSASLFALACALAQPASAQLEDKPVPMDKAPFHIPVFSNDYAGQTRAVKNTGTTLIEFVEFELK